MSLFDSSGEVARRDSPHGQDMIESLGLHEAIKRADAPLKEGGHGQRVTGAPGFEGGEDLVAPTPGVPMHRKPRDLNLLARRLVGSHHDHPVPKVANSEGEVLDEEPGRRAGVGGVQGKRALDYEENINFGSLEV